MIGFGLLVGHLLGDYIFQTDWMAANKTHAWPDTLRCDSGLNTHEERLDEMQKIDRQWRLWWLGNLACTVHCLAYTLAVLLCSYWWLPWWAYAVIFAAHWPIDRFRLARLWMVHVSGQKAFATGPLAPWSVIIVDNVFHLLTLFLVGTSAVK